MSDVEPFASPPSVQMRADRGGFVFEPTDAVVESRGRSVYVDCPVCREDHEEYLFHRTGIRYVRCTTCGMVYVTPRRDVGVNWFDIDRLGQYARPDDRALCVSDFDAFLRRLSAEYERVEGRPLRKTVLLGRFLVEFAATEAARRIGLDVVVVDDAGFRALSAESRVDWAAAHLTSDVDLVILHETLEACGDAGAAVEALVRSLSPSVWLAVTYSNGESLPAAVLRRYAPAFFDFKTAFFNASNLTALMAKQSFVLTSQWPLVEHHTPDYVLARLVKHPEEHPVGALVANVHAALPVLTGAHVATFRRRQHATEEKLSIIFPCFNEELYVGDVLEALLAKTLPIKKEVIIVESNSTDGTRAIVQRFASHPDVKLILEDRPRGKGHAVRTGLAAATGSIILIQDADFEYDLDDYDALLDPILKRKTAFVLGSRSLGLDDWKVRKFAQNRAKEVVLNLGQYVFARTFNVLYRKRTTDINTMFKVFRAECLEGLDLKSDRFDLDIELVCKLVRNGNAPFEVPVNYVARGFEEGKKISFVKDALPSYWAIFKYRFG